MRGLRNSHARCAPSSRTSIPVFISLRWPASARCGNCVKNVINPQKIRGNCQQIILAHVKKLLFMITFTKMLYIHRTSLLICLFVFWVFYIISTSIYSIKNIWFWIFLRWWYDVQWWVAHISYLLCNDKLGRTEIGIMTLFLWGFFCLFFN